jgi:hypothetical protein
MIQSDGPLAEEELLDEWRVAGLHGNKVMASVAIGLFKKYGISHSWCVILVSALLSMENRKKIYMAQDLTKYLVSCPVGKKGAADALEVLGIFLNILTLLAYVSALTNDPLYLFAQASAERCMAAVLEEAWWPLLVYVQELYSYPTCLDTLGPPHITYATSRNEEVTIKAKNFSYGEPQIYPLKESRVYRSLDSNVSVKRGVTTKLTVRIPKSRSHPFWLLGPNYSQNKFSWNMSGDALSFEVTRWGPQETYSRYNATQRATDIIRNIRKAVSDSTHLHNYLFRDVQQSLYHPFDSCPVLQIGAELTHIWKRYERAFSTICVEQAVDLVESFIQEKLDSYSCVDLSPVLRYYQVCPIVSSIDFCVDFLLH